MLRRIDLSSFPAPFLRAARSETVRVWPVGRLKGSRGDVRCRGSRRESAAMRATNACHARTLSAPLASQEVYTMCGCGVKVSCGWPGWFVCIARLAGGGAGAEKRNLLGAASSARATTT